MRPSVTTLTAHLESAVRLNQAAAVLEWDMQTYMPAGGIAARAAQQSVLARLSHEVLASSETARLLAEAETAVQGADADDADRRLVAVIRRHVDIATKLPADLVAELTAHNAVSHDAWVKARRDNDFAAFAPYLEKTVELAKRQAEALGYRDHVYDPLLDTYEQGATAAELTELFAALTPRLKDLVRRIAGRPALDDSLLAKGYPPEGQREATLEIIRAMGYDLQKGRQDVAAHPFCTTFANADVRVTTKFLPELLSAAVYASMHEAGHALYEQGSPDRLEGTLAAGGVSMGVHESQSRLWENLVGRSRPFMDWLHPLLCKRFPEQLAGSTPDDLYRAVNRSAPSLIRIEADEATYNLHIALRFELEKALLEGGLAVKDLPEAWNAKMRDYLGITPDTDANGVLQDVHWASGLFGYFPTYTLGNLLAAQLWEGIAADIPDIGARMAEADFAPLLAWLRERVHRHAALYPPKELIAKATGRPLSAEPFMAYLEGKLGKLYGL